MEEKQTKSKSFTDVLQKLRTSDPGHADVFNTLFESLLENDLFLKDRIEEKEKSTLYSKELGEADLLSVKENGTYYVVHATNSPSEEAGYLKVINHSTSEANRILFWYPYISNSGGYFNVLTEENWLGWQQFATMQDLKILFLPKVAEITQNPESYPSGCVYSVEGSTTTENGHPYTADWTHFTYFVYGDENGENGYKNIIAVDYRGFVYEKSQGRNTWSAWKRLATMEDLSSKPDKLYTIYNKNGITDEDLTGSAFKNKSWIGVGHNLAHAPVSNWINYLCLDAGATGSDLNQIFAIEINGSNPHFYFTNDVKNKNWKRFLDTNDLTTQKHLGENYIMRSADFDKVGFYEIGSLADVVINDGAKNAPDNNVGDYKLLALNQNKTFQTLFMTSPRYDNTIYFGKFWDGRWQGWKKISYNKPNDNLLINSDFRGTSWINQRNTKFRTGIPENTYTLDGWLTYHTDSNLTLYKDELNHLGICWDCMNSHGTLCQIIPGNFGGKTITFSVYFENIHNNINTKYIQIWGDTGNFEIHKEIPASTTGIVSLTATIPAFIRNQLVVAIGCDLNMTQEGINGVSVAFCKLEFGSEYTGFEQIDYDEELSKCEKRFLRITHDIITKFRRIDNDSFTLTPIFLTNELDKLRSSDTLYTFSFNFDENSLRDIYSFVPSPVKRSYIIDKNQITVKNSSLLVDDSRFHDFSVSDYPEDALFILSLDEGAYLTYDKDYYF